MFDEVWKGCRALMTCDADDCEHSGPTNRCSRCHLVHYCSRECQQKHWRTHKPDCIPIDKMRKDLIGIGKSNTRDFEIEPDAETVQRVLADGNTECGVCLEPSKRMNNPIVLTGCHHTFCFSCLKQWNDFQMNPLLATTSDLPPEQPPAYPTAPTCPMCRQTMPNISEAPVQKALHLMAKAGLKKDSNPEECAQLCQEALKQVDLIVGEDKPSTKELVQAAVIQGEAAIYMKEYEKAVTIFQNAADQLEEAVARKQECEELRQRALLILDDSDQIEEHERLLKKTFALQKQGMAPPSEHVAMLLKVGQCQRLSQDWTGAKATYQLIGGRYMESEETTRPQQQRQVFASMAECAYELGRNDIAISVGQGAIDMNRYFPWSHKFVALGLKKEGKLDAAKKVAAEAVIYEAPWDEKHVREVRRWYEENFLE